MTTTAFKGQWSLGSKSSHWVAGSKIVARRKTAASLERPGPDSNKEHPLLFDERLKIIYHYYLN